MAFPSLQTAESESPRVVIEKKEDTQATERDSLFNALPAYFPASEDCSRKNLGHMLELSKLSEARRQPGSPPEMKNPYAQNLEKMLEKGGK